MAEKARPKGRPARARAESTVTDTRADKMERVLRVLQDPAAHAAGGRLDRERLAAAAGVTMRNLDAILTALRSRHHDIRFDPSRGYWMEAGSPADLRVRSPESYRSLESLRDYVARREELVEREQWVALLNDLLARSEQARKKTMGRDFEEPAVIDSKGRVYRVSEPEILYLDVHRPHPEPLTKSHVGNLREAIAGRHPVRLNYTNRQGEHSIVQVEPYFLFHREGTFYLGGVQTHADGQPLKSVQFKPFTITSMRCRGVDVLRERTFERQERFSAEKKLGRTGIKDPEDGTPVEAEFEVFGKFAYNACETDHGEGSRVEWISTGPRAQHLRIRATFGSLYDLTRYLLSFGEFAVATKPARVRDIVVGNIRGMARRYGLAVLEEPTGKKAGR